MVGILAIVAFIRVRSVSKWRKNEIDNKWQLKTIPKITQIRTQSWLNRDELNTEFCCGWFVGTGAELAGNVELRELERTEVVIGFCFETSGEKGAGSFLMPDSDWGVFCWRASIEGVPGDGCEGEGVIGWLAAEDLPKEPLPENQEGIDGFCFCCPGGGGVGCCPGDGAAGEGVIRFILSFCSNKLCWFWLLFIGGTKLFMSCPSRPIDLLLAGCCPAEGFLLIGGCFCVGGCCVWWTDFWGGDKISSIIALISVESFGFGGESCGSWRNFWLFWVLGGVGAVGARLLPLLL